MIAWQRMRLRGRRIERPVIVCSLCAKPVIEGSIFAVDAMKTLEGVWMHVACECTLIPDWWFAL